MLSILTLTILASSGLSTNNILFNTALKEKNNASYINNYQTNILNQDYTDWNQVDYEKINHLDNNLTSIIYGQEYAIKKTSTNIMNMYLDMNKILMKIKSLEFYFLMGLPG